MKKKLGKEEVKKEEKIVSAMKDGIIKTELGFDVVHEGEVKASYQGSDAFRVAVKDYTVLLGI